MHTDRWSRVVELFGQVCDLAPADRAAWLASACADDQTLLLDVEALLRTYETDPGFLEQPAAAIAALDDPAADPLIGRTLGHYRIGRRIGRGGMGVVYEAARDDQEFDRRAAIKILPVWQTATLGDRFRLERRLLAGLDHQGIARLIDAGAADDGTQYFVMEFVEGVPIDEYCRASALPLRARVEVVARVLDALAYAHQQLVVHRDVKPANILVTATGQPKLLDFGIAALISNDDGVSAGATRTGLRQFTPEFASPEQVRGQRISTASDIYSAGALAYLLLTGRRPYALDGLGPIDAMRTICEVDPPPMSAVAEPAARRQLAGDLDNVVAKSLRKVATDRYASATEFAADLRAWLEGRPVSATPHTVQYRARRFASRHKTGVAAAAAVAIAIVGGITATAWQARVARQERDRAQNRFKQVREFSRSLLFDVHDALQRLPGSTATRQILLDRAVQFLDGLAADAGDDADLMSELAEGYRRLGSIQGSGSTDSLGQVTAALGSFEKSATLVERAIAANPSARRLIGAELLYGQLAETRDRRGDAAGAEVARARHLALVEQLDRDHTNDPEAMWYVATGYHEQGRTRTTQGPAAARPFFVLALQRYDALPPAKRETEEWARAYSLALKNLGAAEMLQGALDESERHYRAALAIEESWVARGSGQIRWPFEITYSLSDLGSIRSRREDVTGAIELWGRALEGRRKAAAADPQNTRFQLGVISLEMRLGYAHARLKKPDQASAFFRLALEHSLALPEDERRLPSGAATIVSARVELANALIDLARLAEARKHLDAIEGGPNPTLNKRITEVRARLPR